MREERIICFRNGQTVRGWGTYVNGVPSCLPPVPSPLEDRVVEGCVETSRVRESPWGQCRCGSKIDDESCVNGGPKGHEE